VLAPHGGYPPPHQRSLVRSAGIESDAIRIAVFGQVAGAERAVLLPGAARPPLAGLIHERDGNRRRHQLRSVKGRHACRSAI
jgi:hypothetical protein